jgi:hypothetical protein
VVYYSPEERRKKQELWIARIEDWNRSGLSGSAWCKKQNVPYSQFYYWKSRLSNDQVQNDPQTFIEIEDATDISGVEVQVGEFSIRVSKDFDSGTFSKCVHALIGVLC